MAQTAKKTKKVSNVYKAGPQYATFVQASEGGITEDQHKSLLKGESVTLTRIDKDTMNYLINNNLIIKGE